MVSQRVPAGSAFFVVSQRVSAGSAFFMVSQRVSAGSAFLVVSQRVSAEGFLAPGESVCLPHGVRLDFVAFDPVTTSRTRAAL